MLIGTKLLRYEALLDAIHESGHPQVAEALTILCESVEALESESQVCDARHDHHEMRFSRAGVPRLDAESADFMAGVEPIAIRKGTAADYADQCPTHGLIRIDGRCSMCVSSVPALRAEPKLIIQRLAETARRSDPFNDGHDPETCDFPCPLHNADVFYNIREIA